jgi:hypothetical protein
MATKATRRLMKFNFEEEGAHIALVSKEQGGAANGKKLLIAKSLNNLPSVSDYVKVQKALEQITVTLSMEEFLRKFFDMWSDDAEMLTKLLGFETEWESYQTEQPAIAISHLDWLEEKVSKFQLMKSLHENTVSNVDADDFIEILALQETIEKALIEHNPKGDPLVETVNVEKAQYEQLEKNANEKEVAVAKAAQLETEVATLQEELNVIKAAKEASALEVVKAQLVGLVAEDQLEAIAKSLHGIGAEAAQPIIDSMVAAKTAVEKSTLFEETTHADEVVVEKSAAEKSAEKRAAHLAEHAQNPIL